jgi:L-cysteine/cystine lyase
MAALRSTGVPVLLDAAQALGAIPVDVTALGCDYYAASGQKWLCGPEGSGCLYVRPDRLDELVIPWPGYGSVADPLQALDLVPAAGAPRLDHGFPTGLRSAWALASLKVFAEAGWSWVHERAASLAAGLAERLAELGLTVRDRGRSTLVSWGAADAEGAGVHRSQHPRAGTGQGLGGSLVLRGGAGAAGRRGRRGLASDRP